MNGIQNIAAKGRHGDNTLMHVSDGEVAGLNALARSMMGRELTRNPDTGLPEAFLFAPLLAPALLGSTSLGLGATLGTGALATGLTAGALGAAEASARGMDDPLQRGLMAGLTAGAGSAVGSSLQGAADAAQAAGGAGALGGADVGAIASTGPDLSSTVATAPDVSQAVAGMPPSTPSYNLPSNAPQFTAGNQAVMNMSPSQMQSFEDAVQLQGDIAQGYVPSAPAAPTGPFAGMQKSFEGAKAIATGAPGAPTVGEFIAQNRMPLSIGAMGLSGQAQLDAQQDMRERKEGKDAEKAAKLKATQDSIRRSYANVGRALPTNPYTGRPVFAGGGIVNLMGGGRPFDLARGYAAGGNVRDNPITGYDSSGRPIYKYEPGSSVGFTDLMLSKAGALGGYTSPMLPNFLDALLGDKLGVWGGAAPTNTGAQYDTSGFNPFVAELQKGVGNPEAMAATGYTGLPKPPEEEMARGGYLETGGRVGDGMSDDIPAMIDGNQPAALSDGEFVIPADVVSHLGNGSSDAGAQQLYSMMDRIRQARTGNKEQGKEINPKKYMPA